MHCVWIEDVYLKEEVRGQGLASEFFDHINAAYPDALHRLETEPENLYALEVYKRQGFSKMPYTELYRKPL
jgi:ribosomal protein S18 acetylase RimI-like enzyme